MLSHFRDGFSRPPLGGIDDGTGGFAQSGDAALFGNDGEQRLHGLEKLWPLCACKGPQRCRQFFKLMLFRANRTYSQASCAASVSSSKSAG